MNAGDVRADVQRPRERETHSHVPYTNVECSSDFDCVRSTWELKSVCKLITLLGTDSQSTVPPLCPTLRHVQVV